MDHDGLDNIVKPNERSMSLAIKLFKSCPIRQLTYSETLKGNEGSNSLIFTLSNVSLSNPTKYTVLIIIDYNIKY